MSLDTNYRAPEPADLDQVDLSPLRLLEEGYALVRPRWAHVMGVIGMTIAINVIFSRIPLGALLVGFVNAVAVSGLTYFMIKLYRGENPPIGVVFEPLRHRPLPVLVVVIAQMVLTGVGLLLLVLPGLYMAVAVSFALPMVLFSDVAPLDAIKRSMSIVARRWSSWSFLMLVFTGINLVAALAFGVGLLVSLPATLGGFTLLVAQAFDVKRAEASV